MDLDRRGVVVLAHSPLRPMGLRWQPLVLGSRTSMGTGVGLVGRSAGLCELVPSRLQQPSGVCAVGIEPQLVGGMDSVAPRAFRWTRSERSSVRCLAEEPASKHGLCYTVSRSSCAAARRSSTHFSRNGAADRVDRERPFLWRSSGAAGGREAVRQRRATVHKRRATTNSRQPPARRRRPAGTRGRTAGVCYSIAAGRQPSAAGPGAASGAASGPAV
jgi:hypothetical protein